MGQTHIASRIVTRILIRINPSSTPNVNALIRIRPGSNPDEAVGVKRVIVSVVPLPTFLTNAMFLHESNEVCLCQEGWGTGGTFYHLEGTKVKEERSIYGWNIFSAVFHTHSKEHIMYHDSPSHSLPQ